MAGLAVPEVRGSAAATAGPGSEVLGVPDIAASGILRE